MLEFKSEFINTIKHTILIVVDNPITHTAQLANINDFRINTNGQSPFRSLELIDDDENIQTIKCNDEAGILKQL